MRPDDGIRLSISIANYSWGGPPDALRAELAHIVRAADEAGLRTVWVPDHLIQADPSSTPDAEMLEAYSTLGFLAAQTRRVRLGTMVTGVTFRPPSLLIKVTTLDVLSGGRAWLRVGAGYQEDEAREMGLPLPPMRELRAARGGAPARAPDVVGRPLAVRGRHYRLARPLNNPPSSRCSRDTATRSVVPMTRSRRPQHAPESGRVARAAERCAALAELSIEHASSSPKTPGPKRPSHASRPRAAPEQPEPSRDGRAMTARVSHPQRSATLRRLAFALALAVFGGCAGCGHGQRPAADGAAGLRVVREQRLTPRLEQWTLRTPALRGDTRVRVLLPAGYDRHPRRRYPVLYLLHGRSGDYRDWTLHGAAAAISARSPLIVVMPDGGRMGSYTDWYRAGTPVPPEWETYHIKQLIPWVDRRFRTTGGRRGHAIAGLSMGGFGALSYAARHPGLFAAAASFSGALEGGSAAAWGPRADNTARWRAHLPIDLAPDLRSLALIELRTGNGTPGPLDSAGLRPACEACRLERLLQPMNVRLHDRLRRLGIPHVWDDYGPGTHSWPYWRRDLRTTLPALLKVLARPNG